MVLEVGQSAEGSQESGSNPVMMSTKIWKILYKTQIVHDMLASDSNCDLRSEDLFRLIIDRSTAQRQIVFVHKNSIVDIK